MKKFLLFLLALALCGTANAAWYVVGEFQGWSPGTAVEMTSTGENVYELDIPGTISSNFKIIDHQDWVGTQFGSTNTGSDCLELNVPFQLTDQNAQDIAFKDTYYVRGAHFTLNDNTKTLTVTGTAVDAAWYIAGAFQEWNVGTAVEMTDMGDGTFQLSISGAMSSGFKIIDRRTWNGANLGSSSSDNKIELGTSFSLIDSGSSAELVFAGCFYVDNPVITLYANEEPKRLTVTGTYGGPELWLPGSWASDEGEEYKDRLWAINDETKMTKNGTIYTKTYNLTGTYYESKLVGDGWDPQWGWFNASEKSSLSLNNTPVTLDKKYNETEPGNFKIDIARPGDYNFTYNMTNYTLDLSTAVNFTVYVNNKDGLATSYGYYSYGNTTEETPSYWINFPDTPEQEGEYAGYYKGTIALPCRVFESATAEGATPTRLYVKAKDYYYVDKVNGESVSSSTTTTELFNAVITENKSLIWKVDIAEETETLNAIVADKGEATCTLGDKVLNEGSQEIVFGSKTGRHQTLAISNVPEGKAATVYRNGEVQTPFDDGTYSITCNDGNKLYIAFEDADAATETVTLDANFIGTYCSRHNLVFTATDNVFAYKFTDCQAGVLNGERLLGVVPAGTGLYLRGIAPKTPESVAPIARAEGDLTFTVNITSAAPTVDVSDNLMKPAFKYEGVPMTETQTAGETRTVIFVYDPATHGFMNNDTPGMTAASNMAYVETTSDKPTPPSPVTGIETITADAQPTAVTGIYSITGLRFPDNTDLKSLQPGFYIVNGQKLLVK